MKKLLALSLFILFGISTASAQNMVMVGGNAMSPQKDIVDNAVNSQAHTTLVAAVKAAGLVQTLKSDGPFTVFAPTNAAFNKLPKGTVKSLLKDKNKKKLQGLLTYHVVPGRINFDDLENAIDDGNGSATMKTVNGGSLSFMMNGEHNIIVKDESGNVAHISTYDVTQSNGVIHVIDTVLMPGNQMKKDKMMEDNKMDHNG